MRKNSRFAAILLTATAFGAAAGATGAAAFGDLNGGAAKAPLVTSAVPAGPTLPAVNGSIADMVEHVGASVVQIQARGAAPRGHPMMGQFFGGEGPPAAAPGASMGSGFIVDASGLIVTNNHVVARGGDIRVTLSDGTELPAQLVGRDDKTDLAVLRVQSDRPLKAVDWADSDRARVGDTVFAVGSPFGLGNSVTAGIISARGREIGAGPYDDFLQVDASINSGNSGGPLFNGAGRVVGVNTAIFSPSGGNVGIGFAIPSRMAQNIVRQIAENGTIRRGRIGVGLQTLTKDAADALGLRDTNGALIAAVDPRGPAAVAGLTDGDVVVAFDGQAVKDGREFARAVADAPIGSEVTLAIVRRGAPASVRVVIGGPEEGRG